MTSLAKPEYTPVTSSDDITIGPTQGLQIGVDQCSPTSGSMLR